MEWCGLGEEEVVVGSEVCTGDAQRMGELEGLGDSQGIGEEAEGTGERMEGA